MTIFSSDEKQRAKYEKVVRRNKKRTEKRKMFKKQQNSSIDDENKTSSNKNKKGSTTEEDSPYEKQATRRKERLKTNCILDRLNLTLQKVQKTKGYKIRSQIDHQAKRQLAASIKLDKAIVHAFYTHFKHEAATTKIQKFQWDCAHSADLNKCLYELMISNYYEGKNFKIIKK